MTKYTNISPKIAGLLVLAVVAGVLGSCKSNQDQAEKTISTDLVNNPVTASGKKSSGSLPQMEFEQTKHDFGIMMQGEKLSYTFHFTNTGGSDLVISDASSSCGCTIPDFSKAPVKPGEKGKVEVLFNSAGRSGTESKTVRILTNAQPNTIELVITAEVYVPESKK